MTERYGDELRKRRKRAGLTQRELANLADISEKSIMNYEQGHTEPRPVIKRALDGALSQYAPQPAGQKYWDSVSSTGTG